jgi:hypothetical protein
MKPASKAILRVVAFGAMILSTGLRAQNTFPSSGNVGIGTTSPASPLNVIGGPVFIGPAPYRGDASLHIGGILGCCGRLTQMNPATASQPALNIMGSTDVNNNVYWWSWGVNNSVWSITPAVSFGSSIGLFVTYNGNVGIGTTNPGNYRLAVEGNIGARDVIVTSLSWSDYVFHSGYRLKPLSEVGAYIQAHHHLPDIPTEAEVKEKGVSVGDMQAKLLAKVEELTLHMIRADERNNRLEQQNQELCKRLARLEKGAASVSATAGK